MNKTLVEIIFIFGISVSQFILALVYIHNSNHSFEVESTVFMLIWICGSIFFGIGLSVFDKYKKELKKND